MNTPHPPETANGEREAPIDIEALVNRFLSWHLPNDFHPDGGVSLDPKYRGQVAGTNLLSATQAHAMVEHMLGMAKIGQPGAYGAGYQMSTGAVVPPSRAALSQSPVAEGASDELDGGFHSAYAEGFDDGKKQAVGELTRKVANMIGWLEDNQPDVFKRGIWEAIQSPEELYRHSMKVTAQSPAVGAPSIYATCPPSAAEWMSGPQVYFSVEWQFGWDACRTQHRQRLDAYLKKVAAPPPAAGEAPARAVGGYSYEASMLRNLLARIHGDGGHYVEAHGLDKALEDADEMVAAWRAAQPPAAGAEQDTAEARLAALIDALKTHSGDLPDGSQFGLGYVKFSPGGGQVTSFLWAGQDEIDAAIDAAMAVAKEQKL